jgi:hypothetical protein
MSQVEEKVQQISQALSSRFNLENSNNNSLTHDHLYTSAINEAAASEKPLADKIEEANVQLLAVEHLLEDKCAETFSKLPKYTDLLLRISSNLVVLGSNAKRLKELSLEVAKECDVPLAKK